MTQFLTVVMSVQPMVDTPDKQTKQLEGWLQLVGKACEQGNNSHMEWNN